MGNEVGQLRHPLIRELTHYRDVIERMTSLYGNRGGTTNPQDA